MTVSQFNRLDELEQLEAVGNMGHWLLNGKMKTIVLRDTNNSLFKIVTMTIKSMLSMIFFFFFCVAYSQTSLKTREIDSIVAVINHSKHPVQQDTVVQDRSETGLNIMTIITAVIHEGALLKYVHFMESSMKENGGIKQMTSASTFYYNHHKLIKIEEYLMEGGQKKTADWYYENDEPLHYTVQSEKAAERAVQLMIISNGIMQQVIK